MTKAEEFEKAWRLGYKNDFSMVDKIYHPKYSALERNTGARGLRSILEKILLNEMYESPSRKDIDQIILDKENVLDGIQPKMVLNPSEDSKDSKPA